MIPKDESEKPVDRAIRRPAFEADLSLRSLTPARVALGRSGVSLATRESLDFSLSHALARDAVHAVLGTATLLKGLEQRGLSAASVRSAAPDRFAYLRRPDLGRRLSEASVQVLEQAGSSQQLSRGMRLGLIVADGLSALAVDRHALPLLDALLPRLSGFTLAPVAVVEQARVAIGDQIGSILKADLVVLLIGERPGLSSPDSLGAYITWSPRPGRTDAERNCISNIRLEGWSYEAAAGKIASLCAEASRLRLTGTALKEAVEPDRLPG